MCSLGSSRRFSIRTLRMNFVLKLLNRQEVSSELGALVAQDLQPITNKLSEELTGTWTLKKRAQEGLRSKTKMQWLLTEHQRTWTSKCLIKSQRWETKWRWLKKLSPLKVKRMSIKSTWPQGLYRQGHQITERPLSTSLNSRRRLNRKKSANWSKRQRSKGLQALGFSLRMRGSKLWKNCRKIRERFLKSLINCQSLWEQSPFANKRSRWSRN